MKALAIIISLLTISAAFSADEVCQSMCDRTFSQNGLMCHKNFQLCLRNASGMEDQSDMCYDDYTSCITVGRDNQKACYEKCSTK